MFVLGTSPFISLSLSEKKQLRRYVVRTRSQLPPAASTGGDEGPVAAGEGESAGFIALRRVAR